jgi:hypothetical protein|nr:MAG TPA: hypothetical protein [Caudoviricetes sp.]
MTRTEFENKIEELVKSEEHQEFAKVVAQLYMLFDEYVLSKFEDEEEGWEKLVSSLVKSK